MKRSLLLVPAFLLGVLFAACDPAGYFGFGTITNKGCSVCICGCIGGTSTCRPVNNDGSCPF